MIKPIPASAYAGKDNRMSDVVYERLLEDILSGRRQAGEPLSELALTKVLKVSRTPIHNAMLQLIKDGVVKQDPNCRPVVMGIESKDIVEIFEMRILLEGETAYRATTRMPVKTLRKLKRLHDKTAAPQPRKKWLKGWADYDAEFHRAIAENSGSRRLANDVSRYRLLHRGLNLFGFDEEEAPLNTLQTAVDEHAQILDAIKQGNGRAARSAMQNHLRRWQKFFAKLFEDRTDSLDDHPGLIQFPAKR
jgi:DNA-binding GntR family transcriptional regulator